MMAIDPYLRNVLNFRGITEAQLGDIASRGGNIPGAALPGGKTLYRLIHRVSPHDWQGWFAIGHGGTMLTAWFSDANGNTNGTVHRPAGNGLGGGKIGGSDTSSRSPQSARLQSFSTGGRQYYAVSETPVARSLHMEPLVVADYTGDGSVRGIEFLGGIDCAVELYLHKAYAAGRRRQPSGEPGLTLSNVTMYHGGPGTIAHGHADKQQTQGAGGSSSGSGAGKHPIVPWKMTYVP